MVTSFAAVDTSPSNNLEPARPVALIEDLKALARFRTKMAEHAEPVNVARMMFDRPYAFDRIALAHSSADESLQRLALQLFAQYAKTDETSH